MSDARKRILGKGSIAALHRRTKGAPQSNVGREGKIVTIEHDGSYVVDLLHKARVSAQHFRRDEYTHVSDLIGRCVRKIALVERLGVSYATESVMDGQGLTFAQGEAIHDYIRDRLIRTYPSRVWGRWACKCGHTVTKPMTFSKVGRHLTCERCLSTPKKYVEIVLRNDEYKIVGSPDLILLMEQQNCFMPVEIKSMAASMWKDLARPLPDHVVQNTFYWWLMWKDGYSLSDIYSILYANKEYSFKSPYKEFVRVASTTLALLNPYLDDAKVLKEAKEGGKYPPRVTCASPSAPAAKKCEVCSTCFGLRE